MQQIALNAEVHFHEQEVVSVFYETNSADKKEELAELVFAGAFAIRSMSNLGDDPTTDVLARQLRMLFPRLVAEEPEQLLSVKPRIVPFPGHAGRKRFVSQLRLSSTDLNLDYSAKGFGWLSRGIGYYCPAAVQSVFRYFAHRRLEDCVYRQGLLALAEWCGRLQLERQITMTNHSQLVSLLMVECLDLEAYVPEWLE